VQGVHWLWQVSLITGAPQHAASEAPPTSNVPSAFSPPPPPVAAVLRFSVVGLAYLAVYVCHILLPHQWRGRCSAF
jgi:hypothetical protein